MTIMYQPYPGSDTQLPEPQRPPAPPSVLNAVKVMYVGAVTSLLGIVIDVLTVSATKSAIARRSAHLSASQVNPSQHALVAAFIVAGLIGAAVWIVLARASAAGHNWARITGTVLFGLATLDMIGLAAPVAGPVKIWTVLVWVVALAAVVFLWRLSSTAFFKRTGTPA
jgi:hypothetical protein